MLFVSALTQFLPKTPDRRGSVLGNFCKYCLPPAILAAIDAARLNA
jgi:hypothetical protein